MKIYEEYLKELKIHLVENNETRFAAQQLIRLHKEATFKEWEIHSIFWISKEIQRIRFSNKSNG